MAEVERADRKLARIARNEHIFEGAATRNTTSTQLDVVHYFGLIRLDVGREIDLGCLHLIEIALSADGDRQIHCLVRFGLRLVHFGRQLERTCQPTEIGRFSFWKRRNIHRYRFGLQWHFIVLIAHAERIPDGPPGILGLFAGNGCHAQGANLNLPGLLRIKHIGLDDAHFVGHTIHHLALHLDLVVVVQRLIVEPFEGWEFPLVEAYHIHPTIDLQLGNEHFAQRHIGAAHLDLGKEIIR